MKTFLVSIFTVILFLGNSYSNEVARTWAIVNNEVITTKDLQDYCLVVDSRDIGEEGTSFCDTDEGLAKVLDMLIEDKLIITYAKQEAIHVPEEWVNERLKEIANGYRTQAEFENLMIAKGLTMGMLRKRVTDQYLSKYIVEREIKAPIVISPSEVSTYYSNNISEFSESEIYRFLLSSSDEKVEMAMLAKAIEASGIDETLSKYSDILIQIESPLSDMRQNVADIIASLKPNEYNITLVNNTYQLLYLTSIIPVQTPALKEVQPLVYGRLWEKEFKKRFAEWLDKLKEESIIKILPH